jgi:hypothetical protein
VRLGLVDVETPNGGRWDYHVVHFGRIAMAMIVNEDDDTVLMLWRCRFATDQWGYELLGGLVEKVKTPLPRRRARRSRCLVGRPLATPGGLFGTAARHIACSRALGEQPEHGGGRVAEFSSDRLELGSILHFVVSVNWSDVRG